MSSASPPLPIGTLVEVHIEVPRGSRVKWGADGGVDFLSPVACPFNYGSVPKTRAADGDPADALVLGPTLRRRSAHRVIVVGRVRFLDDGVEDDKWICQAPGGTARPTPEELRRITRFFGLYAQVKRAWHALRGARGETALRGID